jgi:hypothetical protein
MSQLTAAWLHGWVGAAAEQRPELGLEAYESRRLGKIPQISVGHVDLLAIFG